MAQVHFRGIRYGIRVPAVVTSLQVYSGMGHAEAVKLVSRVVEGERISLWMEDVDGAYSLAMELVDLGVNAEADESDY